MREHWACCHLQACRRTRGSSIQVASWGSLPRGADPVLGAGRTCPYPDGLVPKGTDMIEVYVTGCKMPVTVRYPKKP